MGQIHIALGSWDGYNELGYQVEVFERQSRVHTNFTRVFEFYSAQNRLTSSSHPPLPSTPPATRGKSMKQKFESANQWSKSFFPRAWGTVTACRRCTHGVGIHLEAMGPKQFMLSMNDDTAFRSKYQQTRNCIIVYFCAWFVKKKLTVKISWNQLKKIYCVLFRLIQFSYLLTPSFHFYWLCLNLASIN